MLEVSVIVMWLNIRLLVLHFVASALNGHQSVSTKEVVI